MATSALAAVQGHAQAQTASPGPGATEVEGVVVTAERRTTNLQTTPLAISVVSSDALDRSFTNEISGLSAVIPSLEITKSSGFENLVTIRGVGSETPENAPTTVPGVSEFIDGVYIANTISLDQTLFDIDHIEVLRGPQGALYGQSSIGGAITIVTKQPSLSGFDASGDVSAGNYNLFRERAEVNIPVSNDIAIRASVQKYDHDGFTTDAAIPGFKLDDAHDVGGKIAALWKVSPTFTATLTGQWYYADQNGAAQKNIDDPSPDPRVLYQDYPGHFRLATELFHLNLAWDLPWATVKSVTAYQGLNNSISEDDTRSTFALLGAYDDVAAWDTKLENYTEELDLVSRPGGKLDWVIGSFFLSQVSRQFVAEFNGADTAHPNLDIMSNITEPGDQPDNLEYGNYARVTRHSLSGFGQATYHILPKLRLTAGARINFDDYSLNNLNFAGAVAGGPSAYNVSQGISDTVPTGRVQIDYDLTPDNLIYGSVSRGYKPSGVNGNTSDIVVPLTFKSETNTAYEVGSKNGFFSNTLHLNAAAFYYIYKDMQYIETDPFPFGQGTSNIPSVHNYGAEFEGSYVAPDHRLRLNASLALENGQVASSYKTLDSTVVNAIENSYAYPCYAGPYTFYIPGGGPACAAAVEAAAEQLKGKTPPAMPKVSGAVTAAYLFDVPGGKLTPQVQFIYRGSEWARIFDEPSLDKVPSYGVVNVNLDYAPTGSHFRFALTGTNIFNKAGVNSQYTDPYGQGQTSRQYIAPAQVIGTVKYAF
jgi:iron complex outermembrane receptor protein